MFIDGFGFLSTPASIEARIKGGTALAMAYGVPAAVPDNAPSAMLAPLPQWKTMCKRCTEWKLLSLKSGLPMWVEVMTQAECACAAFCSECRVHVIPTTSWGAFGLHCEERASPHVIKPCEGALWKLRTHAAAHAAIGDAQVRCRSCQRVYNLDYLYGHAVRMQCRAAKDKSMAPYAADPTLVEIRDLVHRLCTDVDAHTDASIHEWGQCTTCHTDSVWLERSLSALRAAHLAAQTLGWLRPAGTPADAMCVPLGVPVLMGAADVNSHLPVLSSGELPMLQFKAVQCAVLLVIQEAAAPLISARAAELSPLKGAPGLATISGVNLTHFGSQADCCAAAGGVAVDAGIIINSPAHIVSRLLSGSYPIAIP